MGLVFTVTGPSCSGKTSLVNKLNKTYGVDKIIMTTTRHIKPGEYEGVDYHFVDRDKFQKHAMLVYNNIDSEYYGLRSSDISKCLNASDDKTFVVVLDRKGIEKLKKRFGEDTIHSVYIQIDPEVAEFRLKRRDGKKRAISRIQTDKKDDLWNRHGYDRFSGAQAPSYGVSAI